MFTRYKGISIPENYSGNRFKAPLETETKTHKPTAPSVYGGTKTSISPAFKDALKERNIQLEGNTDEEYTEPFIDKNATEEFIDSTPFEAINEAPLFEDEPKMGIGEEYKEEASKNGKDDNKQNNSSLLGEFSNLFSQISSKIKQDDLIIIGVILLLLSESNEDNYIILPLLLLLLYA